MSVNDKSLALFCRIPIKGTVKTRLAQEAGDDFAFRIYEILLKNTISQLECLKNLNPDIDISFYIADGTKELFQQYIENRVKTTIRNYSIHLQIGSDIGERMIQSFKELFEKGYKKVIIIGSDILGDLSYNITLGFEYLNKRSYVIGPSYDGGFYLIGSSNNFDPDLFEEIRWSSNQVFWKLKENLHKKLYSYWILEQLMDIDYYDDLKKAVKSGLLDMKILNEEYY
ncbi:Protein of unknown function DUF2064 [Calditerrivibrio nitroreducens DSM 19672]|uniref:Glycosyltransferase n=1 Tax=Calditerrivibrio nitroreducens (strain DSM 19672 / NBRC 101217 / Yu37-1) TaxID=768670 RepID=E4TIS6_CALNY|nr:TIGR04282 family arsenosugar biosynthesis glycosyltransferase [Calditerrivibrio nitroreducens]ADR18031.1 Protein of unknown function DUF2064 [Calditerrivibrio nitroreducens DSM 19672]